MKQNIKFIGKERSPTTTTIYNDTHCRSDAPCHAITHGGEREREIYGETGRGNNQLNNNTLIHQPVCMTASDIIKR